jgi:predicted ATPase/class 3 adenylate cyclase
LTFLFTDIEGSTALLRRLGDDSYAQLLLDHHRIIRASIEAHDGEERGTEGDSFFATFASPSACVAAAADMQRALSGRECPDGEQLRVRMGIHTGEASAASTGLVGYQVHRAARIAAVSHGGQVVLSASAAELVRDSMPEDLTIRDLGSHRLKDLGRPEEIYQLVIDGLPSDFPPLRSLSNPELRHNLPVQLSSFVGREAELLEVRALLDASRLVTLTGPGGCGKTRLAVQLAAQLVDRFEGGVWFVDLAPLRDERYVNAALASACGLMEGASESIDESIESWIAERSVLVILDNCEHVVDSVAKLAHRLLRSCPALTVIATSRESLGVDGESTYRVPSLEIPPADLSDVTFEHLRQYASVDLILQRARSHGASPRIGEDAAAIASICRRLDGIPLAIELIAGRLASMPPVEVERRLDDRFRLLTGGSRTALPRQQTLKASVDWSYDLLTSAQRSVLCRMSVFVGPFDLESAEAVGGDGDVDAADVAEVVASLVERSLLQAEPDHRYRLSETVREYASEKIRDLGVEAVLEARRRHAVHFERRLVESDWPSRWRYVPNRSIAEADERSDRLMQDASNLVVALDYALSDGAPADRSLRLAYGASWCLDQLHRYDEAVERLDRVLTVADGGDLALRSAVLGLLGGTLSGLGRVDLAVMRHEEARAAAVEAGRLDRVIFNDRFIASGWLRQGRDGIASFVEASVRLAEQSGDEDLVAEARKARGDLLAACAIVGSDVARFDPQQCLEDLRFATAHFERRGMEDDLVESLMLLAMNELAYGDVAAAKEHSESLLARFSRESDQIHYLNHLNCAQIDLALGDLPGAVAHWREGARAVERVRVVLFYGGVILTAAMCCTASGQDEVAATLYGAAEQLYEAAGSRIDPLESIRHDADIPRLETALGAVKFSQLRNDGARLTFDRALVVARSALKVAEPEPAID